MDKALFERRVAHIRLLGATNNLQAIVRQLSQEFHCSEKAIYSDHYRIDKWESQVTYEVAIAAELKARYRLFSRRAMDLVLDDAIQNPSVKIAAIHAGLAATRDQAKFSQDLGILKRAPIEIQNLSVLPPCEADPVLKEAMMISLEKQRKEKQAMLAATQKENAPKDAVGH